MKKILLLCAAVAATLCATAQGNLQQARHDLYWQLHQRAPQPNAALLARGLQQPPKGGTKAGTAATLPSDRWFPGEWEEVQAICITWPYNCYPADHVGDPAYMADEQVTGYGEIYHYDRGWQSQGMGPVVNVIDTSRENEHFVQVFANLANAIQMGGAEAWIRICNAQDSAVVRRNLARRGFATSRLRWLVGSGNSFWYRDCGPICFYYGEGDTVGMLDFVYYPGRALDDSLPYLIERQMGLPNWETTIEWEGGNCLVDGTGMCLSSDAIYDNNQDGMGQLTWDGTDPQSIRYTRRTPLTESQVRDSMGALIGTRALYILPALHYDGGTGHVDLYADMWDENQFVFSRFPAAHQNWSDAHIAARNIDTLLSKPSLFGNPYKSASIPFPKASRGQDFTSQAVYNSRYTRTYSNHTFVNNLIIQPCFSPVVDGEPTEAWDRWRIDTLKRSYPGYTVYPIDVSSFDGSGGAIHCITKQIPADNPVRILHPSITGNTEDAYAAHDAPIKVIAHNKSGIGQVTMRYRVDGGAWHEETLAAANEASPYGEVFASAIPAQAIGATGYTTVEYYIAATSHNGKTITKPMTASQGGYYTYYVGHNPHAEANLDSLYLGIAAAEAQGIGLFAPNPATEASTISIDSKESYTIVVADMMGRVALRQHVAAGNAAYTLPLASLPQGVYAVTLTNSEGHTATRRIVRR